MDSIFFFVRLIYDYLTNRRLRTKVGNKYSSWRAILLDVPQGLISNPLVFNIYIRDPFLLVNDTGIANYVDNTTPYLSGIEICAVVDSLERSTNLMFNWFTENKMKGNEDKCDVFLRTDGMLDEAFDEYIRAHNCT